jgi:hypothetical protein
MSFNDFIDDSAWDSDGDDEPYVRPDDWFSKRGTSAKPVVKKVQSKPVEDMLSVLNKARASLKLNAKPFVMPKIMMLANTESFVMSTLNSSMYMYQAPSMSLHDEVIMLVTQKYLDKKVEFEEYINAITARMNLESQTLTEAIYSNILVHLDLPDLKEAPIIKFVNQTFNKVPFDERIKSYGSLDSIKTGFQYGMKIDDPVFSQLIRHNTAYEMLKMSFEGLPYGVLETHLPNVIAKVKYRFRVEKERFDNFIIEFFPGKTPIEVWNGSDTSWIMELEWHELLVCAMVYKKAIWT